MGSSVQAAKGPQDHFAWNSGRLSIRYLYYQQDMERLVSVSASGLCKACKHFDIIFR